MFLSYNTDETKLLARRKAFKQSMQFLHKLVLGGHIAKANRYAATKYFFSTKNDNAMAKLGYNVVERVLLHVTKAETAAAIMVFVGLHAAYNSVLAVSAPVYTQLADMPAERHIVHLSPQQILGRGLRTCEPSQVCQQLAQRWSKMVPCTKAGVRRR
jgi:hypothetical protein